MKPYPRSNLEPKQIVFNYRLSRARRVVENAFGILASRFRVLRSPILVKEKTAINIVKCCVALHNFLIKECQSHYLPATDIVQDEYGLPRFVDQGEEGGHFSRIGGNRSSTLARDQ